MLMIPKPSDEIIEKFKDEIGVDDEKKSDKYLMSWDHTSALIIKEMSIDDLKSFTKYDERIYAGLWRFDGRWVRRKNHDDMNIGIRTDKKVYTYKAEKLASVLRVAGKKVHLYICRRMRSEEEDTGFLLVLSDKCGIILAPTEGIDEYETIDKVARLISMKNPAEEIPSDSFLDNLSESEVLRLIEKLSRELGILHV